MPLKDIAIVVGIASYPTFGKGNQPLNLNSPAEDARSLVEWLRDPAGGALDPADIHLITGEDAPGSANPEPSNLRIEEALASLDGIAQAQKQAGLGTQIGRRLYIYMSGHGFSPARQRSCLFAANAKERQSYNVHATAWLNWFQDAGYFREFVLWMDCCMDRFSFLPAGDPILPLTNSPNPPGPTFVGFAAQRPLKAAEVMIPATGQIRGAFTWSLIDGLRGAAVDANGRVTGRSLADWLRQSVLGRLTKAASDDFDIAKEPEIVSEDAELIFARGLPPLQYGVTIAGAGAAAREARIWAGTPPQVQFTAPVAGGAAALRLPAGLYHCELDDGSAAASFEVVADRSVTLEPGRAPVRPATRDQLFRLEFNPPDPSVEISVIDRRFAAVDRAIGQIATSLPFGIFKLRTRFGRTIEDKVLLLDRDRTMNGAIDTPPVATVAPIRGTAASREYQADAIPAMHAIAARARSGPPVGASSSITVLARAFSSYGAEPTAEPWQGLSIVDSRGKTICDVAAGEIHQEDLRDPYALATIAVAPGEYLLRHALADESIVEQSLIVPDGWSLEVHVLRRVLEDGTLDCRPRVSIHMARGEGVPDEGDRRVVELARTALSDERPILGPELEQLLMGKFVDPIAGMIGAHLLLLGEEVGQTFAPALLNEAVTNLRALVGTEHPDVEALSLRCNDVALRREAPLRSVPMFQRSWRLLVEASYSRPRLLGRTLFERLIASSAFPPFLVWSVDAETRKDALAALFAATWGPRTRADLARDTMADAAQVPAAAADLQDDAPTAQAMRAADMGPGAQPAAAEMLSPASRKDWRLARERAARLHLPAAAVAQLARGLD